MPKVKRERTDDTYDEDHADMKPSKKIKKEKVSVEGEKAAYAAGGMDDSTRADENGEQDAMTYEEKLAFVNAIAKPMATKKFAKKLYKLIKKASKHRGYVLNGLKIVQTKIRKDDKGLIILAGDVHPIDIISHIPGICEEKGIPYIFTPSRRDMATAMGMRRPMIIIMVKEHDDYKDLMDECAEVIRNEYVMV